MLARRLLSTHTRLAPVRTPSSMALYNEQMKQTRLKYLAANQPKPAPPSNQSAQDHHTQMQDAERQETSRIEREKTLLTKKLVVRRQLEARRRQAFVDEVRTFLSGVADELMAGGAGSVDWKALTDPALGREDEEARQAARRRLGMPLKSEAEIAAARKEEAQYMSRLMRPAPTADEIRAAKVAKLKRAIDGARALRAAKDAEFEQRVRALAEDIRAHWRDDVEQLEDLVPVSAPYLGVLPRRHMAEVAAFMDTNVQTLSMYGPPKLSPKGPLIVDQRVEATLALQALQRLDGAGPQVSRRLYGVVLGAAGDKRLAVRVRLDEPFQNLDCVLIDAPLVPVGTRLRVEVVAKETGEDKLLCKPAPEF